ncbi:MAG TPA: hypothetical protein DDY71_05580 [Spirochaetia bacterium]|nr:hypothetical protein [Spirochaetia bacterium]
MTKQSITIDDAINFLNELIALDKDAMTKLVTQRVICNEDMAFHPTVQVGINENREYIVGMAGILNGLFGINTNKYGYITFVFEDDGKLSHARKTYGAST